VRSALRRVAFGPGPVSVVVRSVRLMVTWQLTIDALDPERLSRFWGPALGYVAAPPPTGFTTWRDWYAAAGVPADELASMGDHYCDRLVDPAGGGPKIWFQYVESLPPGRHRFHLDVYVAGREVPVDERARLVEARVFELLLAGAVVQERFDERPRRYSVTMLDPEGNVFCVA
jgi:hypothetical protein